MCAGGPTGPGRRMVRRASGTSTSASAMIDGAGAQGITKGPLRTLRETEMMRHQRVDLCLNRVAGPTLERELGQVSICQYHRREWESRDHPGIESKKSA